MKLTILCVGGLKERYWTQAQAEYLKRLSRFAKTQVIELAEVRLPDKPSQKEIDQALAQEAQAFEAKMPKGAIRIALCIEGKQVDSEAFSVQLEDLLHRSDHLVFMIGSSYGLDPDLKASSDWKLSFSKMTFPHQLMRVILLEQVFRAMKISKNEAYHK